LHYLGSWQKTSDLEDDKKRNKAFLKRKEKGMWDDHPLKGDSPKKVEAMQH